MTKLCFLLLLAACSSAETFPPPLGDCDGSCANPIIIGGGGGDGSVSDVLASDVATDVSSDVTGDVTDDVTDDVVVTDAATE